MDMLCYSVAVRRERRYSDAIAIKLAEGGKLNDECIELVINKHAKEFNVNHFIRCDWKVVECRIFEVAETFLKITMAYVSKPTDNLTNFVSHFKNVDTLILANTNCSDETLKAVGQCCPLIRSLDVFGCHLVSDVGMKYLCCDVNGIPTNTVLQKLDVYKTSVEAQGIEFCLDHMTSLEALSYYNIPGVLFNMHQKYMKEKSFAKTKIYNLSTLDFLYPFFLNKNEVLSVCSTICPRVKSLYFSSLTIEELDTCCKFDQLESFNLESPFDTSQVLEKISLNNFLEVRGRKLSELYLQGCTISAEVIARCCPQLKTLTLDFVLFENTGERKFSPLNYLTSFTLSRALLCEDDTESSIVSSILSVSPDLEVLRLQDFDTLSEESADAILKYSRVLKELSLCFFDYIDFSVLKTIVSTNSKLKKLNIDYCRISNEEYVALLDMAKGRIDITREKMDNYTNSAETDSDETDSDETDSEKY